MLQTDNDTIAAIATAPGRGGVGIVRVSGKRAHDVAMGIAGKNLKPRFAHYGPFFATDKQQLDQGLSLFFKGPFSFTGEDVVEFQAHGGPVVLDLLLKQVLTYGVRLARPGEFSERAFLNDKLDLAQAEAIADIIDSSSEQAVRAALRSLQGEFSHLIHQFVERLIQLRIYVEAAIDFPEEEVDFLADGQVTKQLQDLQKELQQILTTAKQGALLRDGMTVVIAGKPNAGKSSLLNALAGKESAIVTHIPGTTRDVLREEIHLDGMPVHIIDTAGMREATDEVEKIGITRALEEIKKADRLLLLVDATTTTETDIKALWPAFLDGLPEKLPVTLIRNKVDISGETLGFDQSNSVIRISAKTGAGIEQLRQHLKDIMGFSNPEGTFMARRRHLDALERAADNLANGYQQIIQTNAGELLAEDLKTVQQILGEITGEFSPDDLLGRIFSSFCIGK